MTAAHLPVGWWVVMYYWWRLDQPNVFLLIRPEMIDVSLT